MTKLATVALAFVLIAAAPLTAAADRHNGPSSAVRPIGVAGPPRPADKTSRVCIGPSIVVIVVNPKTGRREKLCKCRPGTTTIATKNATTGAEALRCLQPAGPRP